MGNSGFVIRKATKSQAKLRLGLFGPSGSGKTFSALSIGTSLGRVLVIDTEHGSASKYADQFSFDVLELIEFAPKHYVDAMNHVAGTGDYDVVIIDSLTHAWSGAGGVLEIVDNASKRSQSNNTFAGWRDATPEHNKLVEAMLALPVHLIVTMRSKTEYVLEKDDRGKNVPRKIGMSPIQRDGLEYEFDVVGEMDMGNTLLVSKTRIPKLKGGIYPEPGAQFAKILKDWLEDGVPLHWVHTGGGKRFNTRIKELRDAGAVHLTPELVLERLEDGHPLDKLGETTLTEAQALERLEAIANNK